MDLHIKNIAKINDAHLVCQGLTAIIGDNDNGKSTVGKVLYSIFHTFQNLKAGFFDVQAGYVLESLNLRNNASTRRFFSPTWFQHDSTIDDQDFHRRFLYYFRHGLPEWHFTTLGVDSASMTQLAEGQHELMKDVKSQIRKVREISEIVLLHDAIQSDLNRYFKNQFLPNFAGLNAESEISLAIKGHRITVRWNSDQQTMIAEETLRNDAWFVGTPLIMDALGASMRSSSMMTADPIVKELIARLRRYRPGTTIARRIAEVELASVYEMIDGYFSGEFLIGNDGELEVGFDGMQKPLNSANLSMGIKMLALLRLMIDANVLKRKDVLVLDEPENHLHPELQVLFADVIVELQRIYDLTVLVTTHSPYFLQALELSARRNKIEKGSAESLRVYQPRKVDKLGRVIFDDISTDTSSMYRKFARTMRELELERMKVSELENTGAERGE